MARGARCAQRAVALAEEVERQAPGVGCRQQLGVAELHAVEAGRVPERPRDLRAPGADVEVGLVVVGVPGEAPWLAPAPALVAQLEGDVEVLGPELDQGGIVVGFLRAELSSTEQAKP